MPSLTHNPRLLALHTRHMELVGKLASELEAEAKDPDYLLGMQASLNLLGACGPIYERGGYTASERLSAAIVPPSDPPKHFVAPPPPKLDADAHVPLATRRNLVGRSAKVGDAARTFDDKHSANAKRMGRTLIAIRGGDEGTLEKRKVMESARTALRHTKYIEPYELKKTERYIGKKHHREGPKWKLEESIWKERCKWSDSGSFWDTEAMYWQAFQLDFVKALSSHQLMKFVLKNDDGESESDGDYDLDGEADDEIDEVGKAIWDHHHTFYRVFDAYASLGTGNDFLHMSPNGFNQFINDCGIAIENHKFCSKNHIDQLFELINLTETKTSPSERKAMQKDLLTKMRKPILAVLATTKVGSEGGGQGGGEAGGGEGGGGEAAAASRKPLVSQGASAQAPDLRAPENVGGRRKGMAWDHAGGDAPLRGRDSIAADMMKAEKEREKEEAINKKLGKEVKQEKKRDRALDRNEFLQCIIRLAIMRYVQPGTIPDVSEAVHELFLGDIEPNLEPMANQDSNEFRRQSCYIEETDAVLLRHDKSMRAIYREYAGGEFQINAKGANELMGYVEWMHMVKDLGLINADFTNREATLAFVWSRMRVIDEDRPKTAVKLSNLSYEDFLDGIVRITSMMTLPTDEDIMESEFEDAGAWHLDLLGKGPDAYRKWVLEAQEEFENKKAQQRISGEPEDEARQPIWRAVDHLLHIIIRTIETATHGADDLNVTSKEIKTFRAKGLGKPSSRR